MSLIKNRDLKNHLSARQRRPILPYLPAGQPDEVGFSGVELGCADLTTDHSVEGPLKQLSSRGLGIPPVVIAPRASEAVAPAASRSVQA